MSALGTALRIVGSVLFFLLTRVLHYGANGIGFAIGLVGGIVAGYFLFVYSLPVKVEDPVIKPLSEEEEPVGEEALKKFHEHLPPWVRHPDYERVDWLNRLLAEMWPYLNKAICQQVREQVTPILHGSKPAFLDVLDFEELNLGAIPPAVIGIKTLDTVDDEVIMQPVLRWAANPNIIVAVKYKGVKATVQFVDLFIHLVPRITLKPLVKVFPCFKKVSVSLVEKPLIDFGLKVVGLDVMSIPALHDYISETIGASVSSMLLWPKEMEVYDADPQTPVGELTIEGLKCDNLKNQGTFGTSDPFAVMDLGSAFFHQKTEEKANDLSPDWTLDEFGQPQAFVFKVSDPKTQRLAVRIFDKNSKKQDLLMGVLRFPLAELESGKREIYNAVPLVSKAEFDAAEAEAAAAAAEEAKKAAAGGDAAAPADGAAPAASAASAAGSSAAPAAASAAPAEAAVAGPAVTHSATSMARAKAKLGTISFTITYREFSEEERKALEAAGDDDGEPEVSMPPDLPEGGGVLVVKLMEAKDLEGRHHCNPFVTLRLRDETWKSDVYKKQRSFNFDDKERHEFVLRDSPEEDRLFVKVFSKNLSALAGMLSSQEPLGYCDINLRDTVTQHRMLDFYSLTDSKQGCVKIETRWYPQKAKEENAS